MATKVLSKHSESGAVTLGAANIAQKFQVKVGERVTLRAASGFDIYYGQDDAADVSAVDGYPVDADEDWTVACKLGTTPFEFEIASSTASLKLYFIVETGKVS